MIALQSTANILIGGMHMKRYFGGMGMAAAVSAADSGLLAAGQGLAGAAESLAAPAGPPAPVPAEGCHAAAAQRSCKTQCRVEALRGYRQIRRQRLLKKYSALINVPAARPNSAIAPVQTQVRNTDRHNGFVNTRRPGDFDILFEGDSITDFWQSGSADGGIDVQKKYFGDAKVATRSRGRYHAGRALGPAKWRRPRVANPKPSC